LNSVKFEDSDLGCEALSLGEHFSTFRNVHGLRYFETLCFVDLHLFSVLVDNQLDAQFFFLIYLFQFSTCFEHPCAHHQENQLY